MRYEIEFAPEAAQDHRELRVPVRSGVRVAIETDLRHEPTKTSESRIERVRGISRPQYRLRIGDIRVFCDVTEASVQVLAIVVKTDAHQWLEKWGEKS